MSTTKSSLLSVHFAILLLGGTAQFSNLLPLSALDITLWRALIAFFCLVIMVRVAGDKLRLRTAKCYLIGCLLGVLMAIHWVTYFAGMQLAGVTVGIIAFFTFPVMTVFIEPLFESGKPHWRDKVSALMVFIGIVILMPEADAQNDVTLGILLGILSAFFYAMRNVVHRHYFTHYSGSQAMAFQTLIIVLVLCLFSDQPVRQVSANSWLLLLVLGAVFTALPHALVASALQKLTAKTFSLITCLQPLYASILAMILLSETSTWQTWLGGAMVVSAAVFETVKTARSP